MEGELTAGLTAGNWRERLRPLLAGMAGMKGTQTVTAPVHGAVLAGTVNLPATITINGDTTIIAQRIVLGSRTLRVVGGHALHLYPVAGLTAPPQAHAAARQAGPVAAQAAGLPITIDNSGSPGSAGAAGPAGNDGRDGFPGDAGQDADPLYSMLCTSPATPGEAGGDGGTGSPGAQGSAGGDGGAGTEISLDIPDGSAGSYLLITSGGAGGAGGRGGDGGGGGTGGAGGEGGYGAAIEACPPAGGGSGGTGGNGADGGQGGSGGAGGNGGDITVTYPPGYDPASIQTRVGGGPGGAGGSGGDSGYPGVGGAGGEGGFDADNGQQAPSGDPGFPGLAGAAGTAGSTGADGAAGNVDLVQRDASSDVCDGMQDMPQAHANLQQLYSSFTSNDPFPAEEPPPSALPDCPPPPPPPSNLVGAKDVVFGDSFISGEGAPNFDVNPETAPTAAVNPRCHVALTAWPALIYTLQLPTMGQVTYQNWACSGAEVADVQNQVTAAVTAASIAAATPGADAQGLGRDTRLVQLSAGGNDLNFGPILKCAVTNGPAHPGTQTGCVPGDAQMRAMAALLRPALAALYKRIAAAAPNAVLEVAGYPVFFPVRQSCTSGINRADEQQINDDVGIVDQMIAWAVLDARAARVTARFLAFQDALAHDTSCPTTNTRTDSFHTCPFGTGNTHGVNVIAIYSGANETSGGGDAQGLFHPNHCGHEALRDAYIRLAAAHFPGQNPLTTPALANGALVSDESTDSVYVAAGGALFGFTGPADVTVAGYPASFAATALAPGQISLLPAEPADGTLLKDASTGTVYSITCGQKTAVTATAGAVTVPSYDLAVIPDATSAACPP